MRFITTIILATSALTSAWPLQVYAQQQNATQQQIQRTTVPYGQQPLAPTTTPAAPSAPVTTIPQVAPIPKLAPLVDVREQAELAAQALQAAQNAPAQQPAANTRQPAPQAMPNAVLLVPAQQQMMMAPPQQQLVPVGQAAPQPAPQATADAGTNNTPDATTPVDAAAEQVQAPDASMDVESSAALRPTPLPEASKESVVKETNKGIDMDLEPSLVGGMGEDASNGDLSNPPALDSQDDAALSYEDQLRIRTKEIEQRAQSQAFEQSKRSTFPLETYQIRDKLRKLKETKANHVWVMSISDDYKDITFWDQKLFNSFEMKYRVKDPQRLRRFLNLRYEDYNKVMHNIEDEVLEKKEVKVEVKKKPKRKNDLEEIVVRGEDPDDVFKFEGGDEFKDEIIEETTGFIDNPQKSKFILTFCRSR